MSHAVAPIARDPEAARQSPCWLPHDHRRRSAIGGPAYAANAPVLLARRAAACTRSSACASCAVRRAAAPLACCLRTRHARGNPRAKLTWMHAPTSRSKSLCGTPTTCCRRRLCRYCRGCCSRSAREGSRPSGSSRHRGHQAARRVVIRATSPTKTSSCRRSIGSSRPEGCSPLASASERRACSSLARSPAPFDCIRASLRLLQQARMHSQRRWQQRQWRRRRHYPYCCCFRGPTLS